MRQQRLADETVEFFAQMRIGHHLPVDRDDLIRACRELRDHRSARIREYNAEIEQLKEVLTGIAEDIACEDPRHCPGREAETSCGSCHLAKRADVALGGGNHVPEGEA